MHGKESQHIEWKECWRDDNLKTLSAFANTAGGKLYVGIRDDGSICGVDNSSKLLEDLPNKIINILGVQANVRTQESDDLKYVEIEVAKSPYPVSFHGRFYIRSGSTTQELKGNALQRLLLTANNLTWDEVAVPDASWDEIDSGVVRLFTRKAIQVNRLPIDVNENSVPDLFENLGLSKNGALTRAAMLLFSKKPTRYCFLGVCKIGRFRGNSHVDLVTDDVVECPLFQMPDRIMELLIAKYLQKNFTYSGLQRIETLEYPEMALREAILNAVIHRDYGANTFFTIKVFDHSLELWNEGELMFPLRIESLKEQHLSRLRNKLIANIFYRSGQIESWGRGTLKIVDDARKGSYPEPEFEYFENGVLVRFGKKVFEKGQQIPDVSNIKHAGNILELIRENPKITILEMSQTLFITTRTVERILSILAKEEIIKRSGTKKEGDWLLPDFK
ncbi:MAG: putative DNA binding domain-containing protein [Prevotellaceae bacterium]|jgi:ATP-dependent DNA helicase RecG|nr:putative DNA binding domain-containing protein [Prevotellaceae bacterium]